MESSFRLFPEQASTIAGRVDGLYAFLVGITVLFAGLIFLLLLSFLQIPPPPRPHPSTA